MQRRGVSNCLSANAGAPMFALPANSCHPITMDSATDKLHKWGYLLRIDAGGARSQSSGALPQRRRRPRLRRSIAPPALSKGSTRSVRQPTRCFSTPPSPRRFVWSIALPRDGGDTAATAATRGPQAGVLRTTCTILVKPFGGGVIRSHLLAPRCPLAPARNARAAEWLLRTVLYVPRPASKPTHVCCERLCCCDCTCAVTPRANHITRTHHSVRQKL